MNSSLEIVKDQTGYFHHPDGYPLVVIFDSKNGKNNVPEEISWQEPVVGLHTHELEEDSTLVQSKKTMANTRPLKFVNISRPVVCDKTKNSTRTHVINDLQRRKREHQSSVSKPCNVASVPAHNAILCNKTLQSNLEVLATKGISISRQPFALLDPFTIFPISMEPYMYMLIHRYLSIVSNFARPSALDCVQNLATQGWFPMAMTDPALFHSILCMSALHMDLVTGRRESLQKFKHMKEAVHLLSTRLQDNGFELSDSTIAAVAHLAEFESIEGNFINWSHHMDGLYKMVQIRGGFATLNDSLRSKIWRADISGCIGTLSKPRFDTINILDLSSTPLSPKRPISALGDGLKNIKELFPFDGGLIGILDELQYLSALLNNATVDFLTVDRIVTSLQHHLLLCQSAGFKTCQNALMQELCCMGALVYLQTIHQFHVYLHVGGFHGGVVTDRALIQNLKSCLDMAEINTTQTRALFIWTIFLGGAVVAGTKDRAWFVARLVKAVVESQIRSWEDAKSSLMTFLWVDRIHENPCRDLWDEALITVTVLFGGDFISGIS